MSNSYIVSVAGIVDASADAKLFLLSADDVAMRTELGLGTASVRNESFFAAASHSHAQSDITSLVSDLALKAPLASPVLTGTPTAPTAGSGENSTQIATTAFVATAVSAAVTGLLDLVGDLDCSANPNYPAYSVVGDTHYVTVAGKIGGASGKSVEVGDAIVCKADNAGGTEASVGTSWFVLEHNLVGALLTANNLSDLTNPSTARTNLGLGTLATQNGTSSGTNTGDQDLSGYLLKAGGTMTGVLVTTASTTSAAGLVVPAAVSAPSSPFTGEIWVNTAGTALQCYINSNTRSIAFVNMSQTWSAKQTFLASASAAATIVIPHGSAPTSPVNGDVWSTTSGWFVRTNGTTEQLSTVAGTLTLTNKTLTAPIIATISNTGTITLPTATCTLIGKDTTDTLTAKRIQKRVTSTTSASSLTPDISAADFYEYTALAAALTINNPTGTPVNTELLHFRFQDNGTGRSLTWDTQFRALTATMPTTTVANKTHRVTFEWNSGDSTWDCLAVAVQP